MPKINKKDFVEIEYTGRIKGGMVFDTTSADVAKENDIYNKKMNYSPAVLCVGEHQIIQGLDKYLEGREIGEEYEVTLRPDEAFGKKDAKLLKIVPLSVFKKQNITPVPGLQLNIDGMIGTVRAVTGGRTVVDFNHPLSGRAVVYKIKIIGLIKDTKQKIKSYFKTQFNITDADVEVKEEKAEINLNAPIPKGALEKIKEKLIKITDIKDVEFGGEKKSANISKESKNGETDKEETKDTEGKEETGKEDAKKEKIDEIKENKKV